MITADYCRMMARYNAWQNHWIYAAVDGLTEAQRNDDRGLFWGSIRATLAHLLWADTIWTARFDGGEAPDRGAVDAHASYDWAYLWATRPKMDARIAAWAWSVTDDDLSGDLTWYSGFFKTDMTRPRGLCVMQIFNHQTHHRGQVHAGLTALGVKTDDTDLPFMPDEVPEWR